MLIDRKFREVALQHFREEVGDGKIQRIDGLLFYSPLPKYWFWKARLRFTVLCGDLVMKRWSKRWFSVRRMPYFGLPDPKKRPWWKGALMHG